MSSVRCLDDGSHVRDLSAPSPAVACRPTFPRSTPGHQLAVPRLYRPASPRIVCRVLLGLIVFVCGLLPGPVVAQTTKYDEGELLFATRVWPLFESKCLGCHGQDPDDLQGEFDLSERAAMLRGGESGESSIDLEAPAQSLLLAAIRWESLEMPPKANDRLSAEEIASVARWVELGASWPQPDRQRELRAWYQEHRQDAGVQVATAGGLSESWDERPYQPENLWAYQPLPERVTFPEGTERLAEAVDALIAQRAEAAGLQLAGQADRRTLLRRVTYDLTGLPPTPDEIADYLNDSRDEQTAWLAVVDRLLASPHYGEHWGRHWLDVVRYADSSGFANDYQRGNAWRYRDWVVRAFNDDKPFDRMILEQLAGDELDPNDSEMLIATGFLRMGPWELTGMEVAKVARQRFLDDITDAVGQVFLSHPLQCARCHDHKFDPISTRDYYQLQAVFATTQFAERPAEFLPEENLGGFAQERARLLKRQEDYQSRLDAIHAKQDEAAKQWYAERGLEYVPRAQALREGRDEAEIVPRHHGLAPEDLGWERIARKGLERLAWELERFEPLAFSVYNGPDLDVKSVQRPLRLPESLQDAGDIPADSIPATSILAGGDPFSPIENVQPAVWNLVAAGGSESQFDLALNTELPTGLSGRRTELARWLTDPRHPLVSRSIANRVWLWHFGKPLAGNPNNFGAMGEKPTHPELLDLLAVWLVDHGWSLKSLHRELLRSETYRRASQSVDPVALAERDPRGELWTCFPSRRLTAEEIRDSQLAISGELNRELGGIPVRPEINWDVALQPRQVMGTFAEAWQPSPRPEQRHRRSLYVLQLRGLRDPFMELFNQPVANESRERRETSTVTPQVFALFNSEASHARALALAARLQQANQSREETLQTAFRLVLGRKPTLEETQLCLEHWQRSTERLTESYWQPTEVPHSIIREAIEENTGERFQYREVLEVAQEYVSDLAPGDVDPATRGLAEVCLVLFNSNEFLFVD